MTLFPCQSNRERKKAEYNELQSAVDQLTAQLAAIRALEARNEDLEVRNASLVDTHVVNAGAISSLQEEVSRSDLWPVGACSTLLPGFVVLFSRGAHADLLPGFLVVILFQRVKYIWVVG